MENGGMELSEWSKGVLELWSGAKCKTGVVCEIITPSLHMKSVRCPVAKEVGMGNPAEKTTRHPTSKINSNTPGFGKFFFAPECASNWRAEVQPN